MKTIQEHQIADQSIVDISELARKDSRFARAIAGPTMSPRSYDYLRGGLLNWLKENGKLTPKEAVGTFPISDEAAKEDAPCNCCYPMQLVTAKNGRQKLLEEYLRQNPDHIREIRYNLTPDSILGIYGLLRKSNNWFPLPDKLFGQSILEKYCVLIDSGDPQIELTVHQPHLCRDWLVQLWFGTPKISGRTGNLDCKENAHQLVAQAYTLKGHLDKALGRKRRAKIDWEERAKKYDKDRMSAYGGWMSPFIGEVYFYQPDYNTWDCREVYMEKYTRW